jgi:hypothetical protein
MSFNTTALRNAKYADLGSVTIYFNDSSYVTKTISSVGGTIFDPASSKTPTSITVLGTNYPMSSMPTAITYPDSTHGNITFVYMQGASGAWYWIECDTIG